jgi:bifunctional DNA-binding transcriptional regulator/antitoxin component of YhaV-PrlF toxin-antitoxin module
VSVIDNPTWTGALTVNNGRVSVPKDIRKLVGLGDSTAVRFEAKEGLLVIIPAPEQEK